ncbi:MAG: HAD-IIA family hydrolase [Thermoprotei archaeon]
MYKALLIDVDGVVKLGKNLIPRVAQAVRLMRESPLKFLFVTNNSTKTPKALAADFAVAGLDVKEGEIMTSSQVLVGLLGQSEKLRSKAKLGVYVIGESGVVTELESNGYTITSEATPGLVVVGLDRGFTYSKLATAIHSIMLGASYICTNTDVTYPTEQGLMPGAGSIAASITAAAGKRPMVVGKPSKVFFRQAVRRLGVALGVRDVLVVGDRPETDIKMANLVGCDSALVLSGVTRRVDGLDGLYKPTYVFSDLYEVVESLLQR